MNKRMYEILKIEGMLNEFYPKASGNYERDVEANIVNPNKLPRGLK